MHRLRCAHALVALLSARIEEYAGAWRIEVAQSAMPSRSRPRPDEDCGALGLRLRSFAGWPQAERARDDGGKRLRP